MKKIVFYFILCISFISSSFGQNQYKVDLSRFATIDFPAKANKKDTLGQVVYSLITDTANFIVVINKDVNNPLYQLKEGELTEFYGGVISGILETSKGKLLTKKEIDINGLKGVDIEFSSPPGPNSPDLKFERILYTNRGIFIINYWTASARKTSTQKDRDRFFNSFQIALNKGQIKQYTIAKEDSTYNTAYMIGRILGYLIFLGIIVGVIYFIIKMIKR